MRVILLKIKTFQQVVRIENANRNTLLQRRQGACANYAKRITRRRTKSAVCTDISQERQGVRAKCTEYRTILQNICAYCAKRFPFIQTLGAFCAVILILRQDVGADYTNYLPQEQNDSAKCADTLSLLGRQILIVNNIR